MAGRRMAAGVAATAGVCLALLLIVGYTASPMSQVELKATALEPVSDGGSQQQTEMLKAVWKPLRPQFAEFYPDQIWLYAGKETYLDGHGKEIGDLKSVLRRGHYQTKVMTWNSLDVAPLRSVCWDESTHVMIFPPFAEYPDVHDIARKDLRAYVSGGNNVVFLGGFASLGLMNDVFGFRLKAEVYEAGPFYRSPRYAPGTIFEYMPSRIGEVGSIYGVKIGSLPPGGRSYYDTLGESVVWSVRYGFGMITYVGNDMTQAYQMGPWHKVLRAAVAI